jgi:DNA replication and repair protein RecF
MYLQRLTINNFKNYEEAELAFSGKINCFVGNNGVGKTNLLDAIHYLSVTKSFFNLVDNQNIRHEAPFFAIHGAYITGGETQDLVSCIQQRNQKKQLKINKKDYDRMADHIGRFPVVMISPSDRDLINDGSDLRRKFLDGVISQFDRAYLDDLIAYNKALMQRNALLKHFDEMRFFDATLLEIWDHQLSQTGMRIYEKRKTFLEGFVPMFSHYFSFISNSREQVDVVYDTQLGELDMEGLLAANIDRDRSARYTTVGIHKDDLDFRIDTYPVKKYGSQGQQKSFVIAIKLAQFHYTRQVKGSKPILLLDDIFDKLDGLRVEQIIRLVGEDGFGQVFITDTQRDRIAGIFSKIEIDHKIFEIVDGSINESIETAQS